MVGKTGAGKTTVAALLALGFAGAGRRVLAVDTDLSPNLGLSLGLGADALRGARTVPRALTTGRGTGGISTTQIVDAYGLVSPSGITVFHALAPSETEAGCGCAGHSSVNSPLSQVLTETDVAVIDLEEGLDHLNRPAGTLAHVDHLLVVIGPTRKSVLTARRLAEQARQWGVAAVSAVGNLAGPDGVDRDVLAASAAECGVELLGVVPASAEVAAADRAGAGLTLDAGGLASAVRAIVDRLAPAV